MNALKTRPGEVNPVMPTKRAKFKTGHQPKYHQLYVPRWLIHFKCSKNARLMYAALSYHKNRTTGLCYPSITRLAHMVSLTYKTAQKAIKELKDLQLILIKEDERSPNSTNRYHFLAHPVMGKEIPEVSEDQVLPFDHKFKSIGIPTWLARQGLVGYHAKLLYGLVAGKANGGRSYRSYRGDIAKVMGCDTRTFRRARSELEQNALLSCESQGQHRPSCYRLLDHAWMTEDPADLRTKPGSKNSGRREKTGGQNQT